MIGPACRGCAAVVPVQASMAAVIAAQSARRVRRERAEPVRVGLDEERRWWNQIASKAIWSLR